GAGQLAERADRDPGALHVEDEVGEAVMPARGGVGAGEEDRPLRVLCPARPDLLAGHAEAVAVGLGERADRGEVAAGIRLAEELAPDLVAGQDRREETARLRLGALRGQRRPRIVVADPVVQPRPAAAGEVPGLGL